MAMRVMNISRLHQCMHTFSHQQGAFSLRTHRSVHHSNSRLLCIHRINTLFLRHRHWFCSSTNTTTTAANTAANVTTQAGQRRILRRLVRIIRNSILLGIGGIFGLFGLFYINHKDEGNWKRSIYFWSQLYPIYVHYRWIDFYTRFAKYSQNDRDAAFNKLHIKYKTSVSDIVRHLRGFYIKLAQLGAARTDIIPPQWVEPLRELEDNCPSEDFLTIKSIIEKSYNISSIWDVFEEFDEKPLGAASIGQTHFARLKSNDKPVVVKVQYPDVEQLFRGDFLMARKFCAMAQPAHLPFLDETEKQFLFEFNYELEASNLELIHKNMEEYNKMVLKNEKNPFPNPNASFSGLKTRQLIKIPQPYKHLCTPQVLVMEYLPGDKLITSLTKNFVQVAKQCNMTLKEYMEYQKQLDYHPSSLEMRQIAKKVYLRDKVWNVLTFLINNSFGYLFAMLGHSNGKNIISYKNTIVPLNIPWILDVIADAHGYEILINGAFNGDPHPGNILICNTSVDDQIEARMHGEKENIKSLATHELSIGLIDYGQVKHLTLEQRIELSKLCIYLCDDNSDYIVKQLNSMGHKTKYNDPWVMEKTARMFFDRDDEEITQGLNAQMFLEMLDKRDPVVNINDDYVMVGRLRLLMSGLFHSLGYTFKAAKTWRHYAERVLHENNIDPYAEKLT